MTDNPDTKSLADTLLEESAKPLTLQDRIVGLIMAIGFGGMGVAMIMWPAFLSMDESLSGRGGRTVAMILEMAWSRPVGGVLVLLGVLVGWGSVMNNGTTEAAAAQTEMSDEHSVLVYLNLSDDAFGSNGERKSIHALSHRLQKAIEHAKVGELDGDEFGAGRCTLFMYGPDADALFATIEPILRSSPHAAGAYVVKRYGEATDPESEEVRIDL